MLLVATARFATLVRVFRSVNELVVGAFAATCRREMLALNLGDFEACTSVPSLTTL